MELDDCAEADWAIGPRDPTSSSAVAASDEVSAGWARVAWFLAPLNYGSSDSALKLAFRKGRLNANAGPDAAHFAACRAT